MRPRSSMASPAFVMFTRLAFEVGFAAHAERVHARAVHRVLDLVFYSRPRVTPRFVRNIFTVS